MTALERIQRAKSQLMLNPRDAFFATFLFKMGAIERQDIETMTTDGESLFYKPSFVDSLNDACLRGVLCHEIMHVALLHHCRRGNRDLKDWNIATDYAINWELDRKGYKLPNGALIDSQYSDMSADQIFAARQAQKQDQGGKPDQAGQPGKPDSNGKPGKPDQNGKPQAGGKPDQAAPDPGMCGGIIDAAQPQNKAALAQAEQAAKQMTMQAAMAAKAAGDLPGFAKTLVDEYRKPVVDWRATLRRYIDESAAMDYSWSRPNRRWIHTGLIMPGMVPDGIGHLAVIVDVSGSIDRQALAAFMGEVQAACDDALPDKITIIQCNTRVVQTDEYQGGDSLDFDLNSGGGTNMTPALAACDDASVIICFTDLEFSEPGHMPPVPTLWAHWGKRGRVPSFGEVIAID